MLSPPKTVTFLLNHPSGKKNLQKPWTLLSAFKSNLISGTYVKYQYCISTSGVRAIFMRLLTILGKSELQL